MSAVQWTEEQRRVIDSRRKSVLVSAAAGSGKTAVLTERIVARLLDKEEPIDIDRLLVVTFTNAAAAEMRERIRDAITDALEADPENLHLRRQVTLLHHAQITTYDSFCLYLVRNYFQRIDLSPTFRVADPGEASLLAVDVMDRVFGEAYEEKEADFIALIEGFSGSRSDENVRDMVRTLSRFASSYPYPEEWLLSCEEPYRAADPEELYSGNLMQTVLLMCRARIMGLAEETELCAALAGSPDGPEVYVPVLSEEAAELREIAMSSSLPELSERINRRESRKLPPARGFAGDMAKKEHIQSQRKKNKAELERILIDFFPAGAQELMQSLYRAGGTVRALTKLSKRFLSAFREAKREKNMIDFSDMEHYALEILVDPETRKPTDVADSFRAMFCELMVDEYQDSNFLQEEILHAIARTGDGEKNLFMVGDVKQSIYRFRLARPEIFLGKYDAFSKDGAYEERIDLHKNFRSRPEVLAAVNDICRRLMGPDLGLIDYDDEAALYPGATYPKTDEAAVRMFVTERKKETLLALGMRSAAEAECRMIAREINRLVREEHVTDAATGTLRDIRYRDIVILLRSPGSTGELLVRTLAEYGIPALLPRDTGYFDTVEVRVLLSMLSVIDNPRQDIPLTAVLRSPIGGFSDDELAEIRAEDEDAAFCDCVLGSQRTRAFCELLNSFRDRATYEKVHELISGILSETGYLDYVSALPGGQQKAANLRMLIEKAILYEQTSFHGLYHFIRYIENIQRYNIDLGEADIASGESDAVRVMSIHKSKGLEFPVVFVSFLGKGFNKSDEREKLVIHPTYGIGTFDINIARRTRRTTILREGIEALTGAENLGEEMRVLYVALTRAREKLILTGAYPEAEAELARRGLAAHSGADGRLSYYRRITASSMLDWVIDALLSCGKGGEICFVPPEAAEAAEAAEDLSLAVNREALLDRTGSGIIKETEELLRLNYRYLHEAEKDIRPKVSVSDLKHQAMLFEEGEAATLAWVEKTEHPVRVPSFAADGSEKNRGALRGSAVHRVMECIDFAGTAGFSKKSGEERLDWARTALLRMRTEGQITEEMYDLVNPRLIAEFLGTELSERMSAAARRGELYKEKPFVMGLSASSIYRIESEEIILVQGIIDVFFREGEEYVIMDYKTDSVTAAKQLLDRYRTQLALYADAVERNKKARIRQTLIYSFHLGETIEVT